MITRTPRCAQWVDNIPVCKEYLQEHRKNYICVWHAHHIWWIMSSGTSFVSYPSYIFIVIAQSSQDKNEIYAASVMSNMHRVLSLASPFSPRWSESRALSVWNKTTMFENFSAWSWRMCCCFWSKISSPSVSKYGNFGICWCEHSHMPQEESSHTNE